MASIAGNVTLAGDPVDWIACAFDAEYHAFAGSATVTDDAYEITGLTAGNAYLVICRPITGDAWQASTQYAANDFSVPADPVSYPYIFQVTTEDFVAVSKRYWKAINFTAVIPVVQMSEIQLHDESGNQNAAATITGLVPYNYAVSSVVDNNLTTFAYWNDNTSSQVYIHWDFGSAKTLTGLRLGSNLTSNYFPNGVTIQASSDNSNWETVATLSGIAWPGESSYTDVISLGSIPLSGSSEPAWPTALDAEIADGDFTWTNRGHLVQPLVQGPLIAV